MATVMQSSTTQLLTQPRNSPFDNPYLLACLIVPHLETYLASNTNTRFLVLEYPAEHLATVLALQTLVGQDVLKVAGIIDAEAASPITSGMSSPTLGTHYAGTILNPLGPSEIERTLDAMSLPGSPFLSPIEAHQSLLAQKRRLSFSKANYLLTSSATEAEIAAFISGIWKVLVEADLFYKPEPGQKHRPQKAAPPSLVSKYTLPNSPPLSPPVAGGDMSEPNTPRVLHANAAALAAAFPYAPPPMPLPAPPPQEPQESQEPSHQQHIVSATATAAAAAAPQQQLPQSHKARLLLGVGDGNNDGASAYAVSVAEEGEFYDDEERRLMPMYMRQSEMRKGNSRKALKWLGLA